MGDGTGTAVLAYSYLSQKRSGTAVIHPGHIAVRLLCCDRLGTLRPSCNLAVGDFSGAASDADLKISCDSPEYLRMFYYSVLMFIVFPVGIPLFFFVMLYRYKDSVFPCNINKVRRGPSLAARCRLVFAWCCIPKYVPVSLLFLDDGSLSRCPHVLDVRCSRPFPFC